MSCDSHVIHTSALARPLMMPSRAEPQNMIRNFPTAFRKMRPGLSMVLVACSMMVLRGKEGERERGREGEREGGREGEREGGREGGRGGGREGGGEKERERCTRQARHPAHVYSKRWAVVCYTSALMRPYQPNSSTCSCTLFHTYCFIIIVTLMQFSLC